MKERLAEADAVLAMARWDHWVESQYQLKNNVCKIWNHDLFINSLFRSIIMWLFGERLSEYNKKNRRTESYQQQQQRACFSLKQKEDLLVLTDIK